MESGSRASFRQGVGAAAYCSSVTCRSPVTGLPLSSFCLMAMGAMKRFGAAPCQWFPGVEEDAVAGADDLDSAAFALAEAGESGSGDGVKFRWVPGAAGFGISVREP